MGIAYQLLPREWKQETALLMDMELKVAARVLMVVVSHLPEVKASPYSAERRRRERVIRHQKSS